MGHVVRDRGHEDLGLHPGHRRRAAPDGLRAPFELASLAPMVLLQEQLQRHQHGQHLFLVHLHPPADRVAVRGSVQPGRLDEVLAAQEQAGALGSADALAPGERHQVETHAGVLPEIVHGRDVGGGVVEGGDGMLLSELGELLVLDPPFAIHRVVEEHHGGLLVDRPFQLLPGLHLHQPHSAVANRVLVAEAVGLLGDDLALHGGEVGKIDDLLPVRAREHGRGPQGQGRGRSRRDHGGLAAEQGRDPLAHPVVELVEHHVLLGCVLDRLHHLRGHERGGHRRVGPRRIDEGTDAELPEIVPAGPSRGGRRGRHGARRGEASHQRQS